MSPASYACKQHSPHLPPTISLHLQLPGGQPGSTSSTNYLTPPPAATWTIWINQFHQLSHSTSSFQVDNLDQPVPPIISLQLPGGTINQFHQLSHSTSRTTWINQFHQLSHSSFQVERSTSSTNYLTPPPAARWTTWINQFHQLSHSTSSFQVENLDQPVSPTISLHLQLPGGQPGSTSSTNYLTPPPASNLDQPVPAWFLSPPVLWDEWTVFKRARRPWLLLSDAGIVAQ